MQRISESSDATALATESDIKSGRMFVQAITAGLGSSGYYSPKILEQAAQAKLITRGTPLHLDHPSESERHDRPERSVQTIAGVFTGDAAWDSGRQALIGEVQIFSPYRERLAEMSPYIGLSITGSATDVTEGDIDGKTVKIIEGLAAIDSVDFVVKAGRGGKVITAEAGAVKNDVHATYGVALRESGYAITPVIANHPKNTPAPSAGKAKSHSTQKELIMAEIEDGKLAELKEAAGQVPSLETQLAEAKKQAEEATAALATRDLKEAATERVREAVTDLHPAMASKVIEAVTRDVPVIDGALDLPRFDQAVEKAVESEKAYAQELVPAGVTGFGQSSAVTESTTKGPRVNAWGREIKEA